MYYSYTEIILSGPDDNTIDLIQFYLIESMILINYENKPVFINPILRRRITSYNYGMVPFKINLFYPRKKPIIYQ